MRRYSEAVKADVRRRMGPPHRQSVAEISKELGIARNHPLQVAQGLAAAGGGGARQPEGS